jgi:hypothetical protein
VPDAQGCWHLFARSFTALGFAVARANAGKSGRTCVVPWWQNLGTAAGAWIETLGTFGRQGGAVLFPDHDRGVRLVTRHRSVAQRGFDLRSLFRPLHRRDGHPVADALQPLRQRPERPLAQQRLRRYRAARQVYTVAVARSRAPYEALKVHSYQPPVLSV